MLNPPGVFIFSNPKVQVLAVENGAMHDVLRLLAIDTSMTVRKRAMYALSTMIRHFPFAQKRFLELGGLSVLGKMFEDKSAENLQVRAVTLLADLIKEKVSSSGVAVRLLLSCCCFLVCFSENGESVGQNLSFHLFFSLPLSQLPPLLAPVPPTLFLLSPLTLSVLLVAYPLHLN